MLGTLYSLCLCGKSISASGKKIASRNVLLAMVDDMNVFTQSRQARCDRSSSALERGGRDLYVPHVPAQVG